MNRCRWRNIKRLWRTSEDYSRLPKRDQSTSHWALSAGRPDCQCPPDFDYVGPCGGRSAVLAKDPHHETRPRLWAAFRIYCELEQFIFIHGR
jgi:hypothetical protein